MNIIKSPRFTTLLLFSTLLAGCAGGWGAHKSGAAAVASAPVATPVPVPTPPPVDPVRALTEFYMQSRTLAPAELTRRASELANGSQTPETSLKQAILLSHTRNPADLTRALALADNVARTDNPVKPLAQLLSQQWNDRRKLEDQLDKQTTAGKEAQRRADQLKTQLDALKNIEKDMADKASAPARKE